MVSKNIPVKDAKVLVLGITFKEDCPDIRNTRVIDIIDELKGFNMSVDVYDPYAEPSEVKEELGLDLIQDLDLKKYSGIIAAVAHKEFKSLHIKTTDNNVVYDLKGIFSKNRVDKRL